MIILDSDVLIDLLRKEPATVSFLQRLHAEGEALATTSLNAGELLRGAQGRHADLAAATTILGGLVEVPFGPRAARRFGRLMHALDRAGRTVPAVDGMVASVALEEGARVATRDGRHFRPIAGLEIMAP